MLFLSIRLLCTFSLLCMLACNRNEETQKNIDSIKISKTDSIKSIDSDNKDSIKVGRVNKDSGLSGKSIGNEERTLFGNRYVEKIELLALKHGIESSTVEKIIEDYLEVSDFREALRFSFYKEWDGRSTQQEESNVKDSIPSNESYSQTILRISKKYGVQMQKVVEIIISYRTWCN